MKKLFILLTCVAVLASCSKDDEWDSDRTLDINIRESLTKADADGHFTPKEIVDSTWAMEFNYNDVDGSIGTARRGFSEAQRDTINWKLKMWSEDVIFEGKLNDSYRSNFLQAFNVRLLTANRKVIAYIPNSVLRTAETAIRKAFTDGDYDTVYSLFDDAYTAIPITQEEYDALAAEGNL